MAHAGLAEGPSGHLVTHPTRLSPAPRRRALAVATAPLRRRAPTATMLLSRTPLRTPCEAASSFPQSLPTPWLTATAVESSHQPDSLPPPTRLTPIAQSLGGGSVQYVF